MGDTEISTVDLLLKKAILLQEEAGWMMLDNLNRKKGKLDEINNQAKQAANKVSSEEELKKEMVKWQKMAQKELMRGFDEKTYNEKLQKAYGFLEEAYRLDDENTEVLLHMAGLLITLTPDDPTDERQLLSRVQALLHKPKNDAERLRVAQATYLIVASFANVFMTKPPGPDFDTAANAVINLVPALEEARDLFAELGEKQWLRMCEEALTSVKPVAQDPSVLLQGDFNIIGRWSLVISLGGITQGIMNLDFARDSSFQGILLPSGQSIQGRWAFVPMQRSLHLQGSISGFQPFSVDVRLRYVKKDFASGEGSDGFTYALVKPQV